MLGVIDETVRRLAENAENGRIRSEDIPESLRELGGIIYQEVAKAVFGNHYRPEVVGAMKFLERFCMSAGDVPIFDLLAMKCVALEWSERVYARTGKLPIERENIRGLAQQIYKG